MNHAKWILMLNDINLISPTPPASFILFNFFKTFLHEKNFSVYQCETVRDHQQGRARIFFLILCGKRWRVYEAIFCLWRHCLNRFYSLLKAAIIKLKLTSILINSSYVQSLLWVNRKRKMVNIAWGHIINI